MIRRRYGIRLERISGHDDTSALIGIVFAVSVFFIVFVLFALATLWVRYAWCSSFYCPGAA